MDTTAKLLASDLMPNTPEVQHGEPMGVGALSIQLPQNGSSKDFTGERFVPGVSAEIEHEHLHRYLLAAAHVKNRIVLDIASGEGYGSYMLAQVATSVIGVDIDVNSVAAASERYRLSNLAFRQGTCERLPIDDGSIDVVVSFETIEHIVEQEQFMLEITRVLKPGGLLIISSPERETYNSYRTSPNEFHLRELSRVEFDALLRKHFKNVAMCAQRNLFGSFIGGEGSEGSGQVFSRSEAKVSLVSELPRSPYLIGFASAASLPVLESSVFDGGSSPYLISALMGGISERDREIVDLRGVAKLVNEQRRELAELRNQAPVLDLESSSSELLKDQVAALKVRVEAARGREIKLTDECAAMSGQVESLKAKSEYLWQELSATKAALEAEYRARPKFFTQYLWLEGVARKCVRTLRRAPQKRRLLVQKLVAFATGIPLLPSGHFFDEEFFSRWHGKISVRRGGAAAEYMKNWYPTPRREFVEGELAELQQEIALLAQRCQGLVVDASTTPEVSVVIPIFNQLRITLLCVRSLLTVGSGVPFEVVLVDDCSEDAVASVLSRLPGVRYVRQPQNGGFIASCNRGAEEARGEHIVFLNNDTQLLPGWIDELRNTFRERAQVGLVGSQLIYPNGQLQEAGGILWRDGSGWNYGRGGDRLLPQHNYVRPVDYCSGASIMIPRALFKDLGGFDPHYSPAYAEDADLALKVRHAGYQVLYQPFSQVVHCEGISSGTDLTKGIKAYQTVNLRKLYDRWRDVLASHRANAEHPELERERGVTRRVLFLDALTPTPDRDAGSAVIWAFMKIFTKLGYGVSFVPEDNLLPLTGYTERLQRMGVECWHYPFISSVDEYLKQHGSKFDVVFLYRAPNAARRLDAVRRYAPQARVVFNTVDLHFVRQEREAKISGSDEMMRAAEAVKQLELSVMQFSDATILLNSKEVELIKELDPLVKTFMLPLIQEVVGSRRPFAERHHIAFIGGFNHPPNVDAVRFFCGEVMPLLRGRLPGLKFMVVGSNPPAEILQLACDDVQVKGFVEDVSDVFDHCRLSVAPLRFGAGMKGKIVTSLSYGVPCITTSIGSEGMGLTDGLSIAIRDNAGSIADAVVELYSSEEKWQVLSDNGVEFARRHFAPDVVERQIIEMMRELLPPTEDAVC